MQERELRDLIAEVKTGRLSRRAFVQRMIAVGLTAPMAGMMLAQSGSTEEVVAAFFHGREDIIPEMFSRLKQTLPGASNDNDPLRHFTYYIDRHIELDGDSHGPMGRELLEGLVADSPQRDERALRAACNSIRARIELWNGTLSTLREIRAA